MKKLLVLLIIPLFHQVQAQNLKDVDRRVKDLIGQMTLDEKVSQLMNNAAAIPRLNIPEYNWWNEGLHGVAWLSGVTVFPQAIALAATWDVPLHYQVATAISDEARVKYRQGALGLTYWSPNINIFRDPRWGRGQETYGEDPFLTSRFGVAFVKGFQGSDPHYLKLVSTPKHYAVHSGPEPLRHTMNIVASERDIWETYLPAFHACIVEGKAYSIMGAYTALNGVPDCANKFLLDEVLRKKWGFKGYVVSDCDAISDIYNGHHYVSTDAQATAKAIMAGCDLDCGTTYNAAKTAISQGLLTEAQIDTALTRLFRARFLLGMFDPVDSVPYNKISSSVVDSKAHRELALKAAEESIVLLKNKDNTLPLKKDLKSILVVGPNAAEYQVLYGNYNGIPSKSYSVLDGISKTVSTSTVVNYKLGVSLTGNSADMVVAGPKNLQTPDGQPGLKAEFFNNKILNGTPVFTRIDTTVNFDWGIGSPDPQIQSDGFSARWTGFFVPEISTEYTFLVSGDDGFRLYINDTIIIDDWADHAVESRNATKHFIKGQIYKIKLEYYDNTLYAVIRLQKGSSLWNVLNLGVINTTNLSTSDGNPGLKAEYFNNATLSGDPALVRTEQSLNFNWDLGSPDPKIQTDNFSARYTGILKTDTTDDYTISVTGDDGFRLFINDHQIIDDWGVHSAETKSAIIHLDKDSVYNLKLEYFDNLQGARVKMEWSKIVYQQNQIDDLIAIAEGSDAIVFVGGISSALEGEEMSVNMEGFSGGDRTSLDLPRSQDYLLKQLHKTGKPMVLILMSGSALSVNWANDSIPAIIESWYDGEEAGNAIANVLFGNYNPAGRLPVTFYKSVNDLPSFTDYSMQGRTYRYFTKEPLYPFGFGLSYTSFSYGNLVLPVNELDLCAMDTLPISFTLANAGAYDGYEVAQLYITNLNSKFSQPIKQLKGFRRTWIRQGSSVTDTINLKLSDLATFDTNSHTFVVESGRYGIQIGSSSANIQLSGIIKVKACPLTVDEEQIFPGKIYPNPTKDKLIVELDIDLARNARIIVYDMEGKEDYSGFAQNKAGSQFTIDCSDLANGTYLLKIEDDMKVFSKKFILSR